jgi:hypothetical protein
VLWLAITVLAVPAVLGRLMARLGDRALPPQTLFLQDYGWPRRLLGWFIGWPTPPTIWDWFITTHRPDGQFVLVTFDDGKQVAGVYSKPSLALTSPEPQGVFISREWMIDEDGDIERPMPGSRGILIPSLAGVRSVRILEGANESADDSEGEGDGQEGTGDQGDSAEQHGVDAELPASEEVQPREESGQLGRGPDQTT